MYRKRHLRPSPDPAEQRMKSLRRHRPLALGHEDVRGWPLSALQTPQRAYLVALHGVDTRRAVLRPADVEPAGGRLNLRPLQIAQLGRPQAVAIADQDHSRVPMAVATGLFGGRHQPLDLGRRQVLAKISWKTARAAGRHQPGPCVFDRPDLKMLTIFLLSGAHGLTSEIPLSTLFRNGCKVAVSYANITASPLAARAQQPTKLPTIGFLGANNASFERASTDAFVQRLRELALLWQILSGTGFPNQFFCDSWVVGFWRGRPWLAGCRIGETSLNVGSCRF